MAEQHNLNAAPERGFARAPLETSRPRTGLRSACGQPSARLFLHSSTGDLAIDRLTSKQRAHLRSLAHDLDPVVRVGKEGLTDAVKEAIVEAFNTRELLKIRVLDASPKGVRGITDALDLDDVQVVQVIGHVAILYRPDPEEPVIELP